MELLAILSSIIDTYLPDLLKEYLNLDVETIKSWFIFDPKHWMLFNTPLFLGMFFVVYSIYVLIRNQRFDTLRKVYIILFSLFFYYKSGGHYYLLLVISAVLTHWLAVKMHSLEDKKPRKALLILIIVGNLLMLAYYKYTYFIVDNINTIFHKNIELWDIFLPIGISFFVFEAISYAVDLYRREMEPARSTLDFCFYISFFPKLLSGPIIRAKDFIPQMYQKLSLTREDMSKALLLIMIGLVKKAIICDYIAENFVSRVFDNSNLFFSFEHLMAVYGYALQIYCDFSGYSDIAIGLALLMGFKIPPNFLTPYKSGSVTEFWRRWHISLSSWLRDYLYISMGGNRKGKVRTYFNLFMTMVIGGLWHGSSWTFVVWGGLHGTILVIERFYKQIFKKTEKWLGKTLLALLASAIVFILLSPELITFVTSKIPFVLNETVFTVIEIVKYALIASFLGYIVYIIPNNFFTKAICVLLTFHFVAFCWIFFRASSFEIAGGIITKISELTFEPKQWWAIIVLYKNVFILCAIGFAMHFLPEKLVDKIHRGFNWLPLIGKAIILSFVFWLVFATMSSEQQPFIYLQF